MTSLEKIRKVYDALPADMEEEKKIAMVASVIGVSTFLVRTALRIEK